MGGGYIAGCRLVDIQQMRPVELGLTAAECHAHTTEVVAVEVAQQDGGAVGGVHRQVLAHHTAVQPLHAGRNRPHTDVAAHHAMQLVVLLEGSVVVFCIDGAVGQTVRCIRHRLGILHLRRCRHLGLQVVVHVGIVEYAGVAAQSHAGLAQRTCRGRALHLYIIIYARHVARHDVVYHPADAVVPVGHILHLHHIGSLLLHIDIADTVVRVAATGGKAEVAPCSAARYQLGVRSLSVVVLIAQERRYFAVCADIHRHIVIADGKGFVAAVLLNSYITTCSPACCSAKCRP